VVWTGGSCLVSGWVGGRGGKQPMSYRVSRRAKRCGNERACAHVVSCDPPQSDPIRSQVSEPHVHIYRYIYYIYTAIY
jgi:hypothetical protein